MALTMFPGGGKNKEPQDRVHHVIQGNEAHIKELNNLLERGWRIAEVIALSGFESLPGEAHYILTKEELL
jgi:hypothetical protein